MDGAVADNITLSPLVGFYKSQQWLGNGGRQSRDASTSTYMQFIAWATL